MTTLRPGTKADVPALAELVRACNETHHEWVGRAVRLPSIEEEELEWDLRFARTGAHVIVAEEDGEVAGAAAFAQATVSREDRTPVLGRGHVNAVFVHPRHWRKGIARRLVTALEDALREQGYHEAQLWTLEGSPAERLYTALGWERDGRREEYPPMGLTTVAYVRRLG